jgi:transposase
MEVIISRCAGLDVHKKTVMACVRFQGPAGAITPEIRTFGTTTRDLEQLRAWLQTCAVTHVALEATGVLWKPVWHILDPTFELLLVNPRDLKRVPGRKTDVKDAAWIAQLLQCGLLRGSFVPPKAIRELRDLTRARATLEQETTAVANRIHKLLEDANLKLGSVATDILGTSGRAMLRAMVEGQTDPIRLADLAQKRLRAKIPALQDALRGSMTDHHRFLLRHLLDQLAFLEAQIAQFDQRVAEVTFPFAPAIARLDTMPGVNRRVAENLIAEIGVDMTQFPTAAHLASWAGICPGQNESAGRSSSATIRKANRWLRRTLGQAAWSARNKKQSYPAAQFRRLAARRGKKRAIVAVGHSLLVAAFYILRDRVEYVDLGPNHFDRLRPDQLTRMLVKRLERLGHKVTLDAAA